MSNLVNKNNVCAVIPFFNEAKTIGMVVEKLKPYVNLIICVNDGSTDNFNDNLVFSNSVILLEHDKNFGKGKALNTGFNKAIELGYKFVATIDGDLQHNPEYLPNFYEKAVDFEVVIGSRDFSEKKMPLPRKLSNFLSSKILSILTNQKILDSQSGYRIINLDIFKKIRIESLGFEAETELILKVAKNGFKIGFVEIPTIYGNDNSKIKNLESILGFIKVIIKSLNEKN